MLLVYQTWHGSAGLLQPVEGRYPWLRAGTGSSLLPQRIWSWTVGPPALVLAEPLIPGVVGGVLASFVRQRACPVLDGNPPGQKKCAAYLSSSPPAVCFLCRTRFRNTKGKSVKKSRDWILEKKERRRRQGK